MIGCRGEIPVITRSVHLGDGHGQRHRTDHRLNASHAVRVSSGRPSEPTNITLSATRSAGLPCALPSFDGDPRPIHVGAPFIGWRAFLRILYPHPWRGLPRRILSRPRHKRPQGDWCCPVNLWASILLPKGPGTIVVRTSPDAGATLRHPRNGQRNVPGHLPSRDDEWAELFWVSTVSPGCLWESPARASRLIGAHQAAKSLGPNDDTAYERAGSSLMMCTASVSLHLRTFDPEGAGLRIVVSRVSSPSKAGPRGYRRRRNSLPST